MKLLTGHGASRPARLELRAARSSSEAGTMTTQAFTDFPQQDARRTVKVASDLGLEKE